MGYGGNDLFVYQQAAGFVVKIDRHFAIMASGQPADGLKSQTHQFQPSDIECPQRLLGNIPCQIYRAAEQMYRLYPQIIFGGCSADCILFFFVVCPVGSQSGRIPEHKVGKKLFFGGIGIGV